MEKFVSYEKLSKKKQRELAAKKRGSWGGLNPVTRKPENPKAYNRKKAGQWRDDSLRDLPFDYNEVYPIVLIWLCNDDLKKCGSRIESRLPLQGVKWYEQTSGEN